MPDAFRRAAAGEQQEPAADPGEGNAADPGAGNAEPQPLTISAATAQIKELVEGRFPHLWVTGEISNFARATSGHCYLTLKDAHAQLRAVIWRTTASQLRFTLEDGLEVVCEGGVEVYAPRGAYQLVIRSVQPKGLGALELALRQLRDKLQAQGLFDPSLKRPLPRFPRRVAVVTSPTGAAIRDFLQVARRRWRGTDVLIVPCRVQGREAAAEIAAAIAQVNRLRHKPDCLVVTRGGGSLEDLWCFNEEAVVRAIHDSRIPVVSGVGHEIDVTLADLAADVRALTPSEAAERVFPDGQELFGGLRQLTVRLNAAMRRRVAASRARLEGLAARRALRQPAARLHDLARRLDELQARADRAMRNQLTGTQRRLMTLAAQLDSLSPLGVLSRGYSVTLSADSRRVVRDASELELGQEIVTRFQTSEAVSRVERVQPDTGSSNDEQNDEQNV